MASFADRSRQAYIEQLQKDPRIGEDTITSIVPVMRVSVMMLVFAGLIGVVGVQAWLGFGGFQFLLGMAVGYLAYGAYVLGTMEPPRFIGAMAVLTERRLLLLGSKRVGVAAEWELSAIEEITQLRKGNLLIVGKIAIKPTGSDPLRFFASNPAMGRHFMEQYRKQRGG
jgi:hypothetical protein